MQEWSAGKEWSRQNVCLHCLQSALTAGSSRAWHPATGHLGALSFGGCAQKRGVRSCLARGFSVGLIPSWTNRTLRCRKRVVGLRVKRVRHSAISTQAVLAGRAKDLSANPPPISRQASEKDPTARSESHRAGPHVSVSQRPIDLGGCALGVRWGEKCTALFGEKCSFWTHLKPWPRRRRLTCGTRASVIFRQETSLQNI